MEVIELNKTYKIKHMADVYNGCRIFVSASQEGGMYYGKLLDGEYAGRSLMVFENELEEM